MVYLKSVEVYTQYHPLSAGGPQGLLEGETFSPKIWKGMIRKKIVPRERRGVTEILQQIIAWETYSISCQKDFWKENMTLRVVVCWEGSVPRLTLK